jgi:hypothetical protein
MAASGSPSWPQGSTDRSRGLVYYPKSQSPKIGCIRPALGDAYPCARTSLRDGLPQEVARRNGGDMKTAAVFVWRTAAGGRGMVAQGNSETPQVIGGLTMENVIGSIEAARRLGVTPRRVRMLCERGRVLGAYQVGQPPRSTWRIPVRADGRPHLFPGPRAAPPLKDERRGNARGTAHAISRDPAGKP